MGSFDEFEGSGSLCGHRAGTQAQHGASGCSTVARRVSATCQAPAPGRCTIRAPLASSLNAAAYLDSLQRYASEYGRLVILYSDRHCIFTKHDHEDPEPIECERAVG